MKYLIKIFVLAFLIACNNSQDTVRTNPDWTNRTIENFNPTQLKQGKTYLSIYSQIYSSSQHRMYSLTAMVSLRNTCDNDTVYIQKATYYNTHGEVLKSYIDKPIYLAPLETIDLVIEEKNKSGGTGSNFIFEWYRKDNCSTPLFEAIMNSTLGQQGLSFTTQGTQL